MPYNEWDDNSTPLPLSLDQMQYELAKRGSMPLRPSGSDVPYVASEVPSIRVPVQPKEPPRPASSSNNVLQALIDKFGISAIPQSVLAMATGFPAEVARGMGYPDVAEKIGYEPTSTAAKDILAGISEAPKAITGSSMGFGPIPELWNPMSRGVNPNDVKVMGANAKRIAGEVRDLKTDFANAQSGIRRENAFGEPTLGVKAQGAVESVAPVVYPKIEKFMEDIGGLKRVDVGPSAKNWSKVSEDTFKREFSAARRSGKSIDEANLEAWKASQLNDVTQGAPGSLGTRYLLPTDKLVQESMLGEVNFEPLPTVAKASTKAQLEKVASKAAIEQFGVPLENLTSEQQVQLRDYLLAMRTVGKSANLPSVLESYPDIANNIFEYMPSRTKVSGTFAPKTKAIGIVSPKKEAAKSAIHELTHTIQDKEGLPQGANIEMFNTSTDQGKRYQNYISKLEDEKEALFHASFMQKKAAEHNIPLEDYIKQNNEEMDSLFKKEAKPISAREANVLNRMDELALKYTTEELEQMQKDLQAKIKRNPKNPYQAYKQVFGEAHARNAERRSKLPFQTRREIFPESTFDVPKEELRYSDVQSESPDVVLKTEEKPKRQSKAEAEALGLYHPVGGGTKLKRPISEMDIQTMDNPDMPLVPKKEMKPEDMVGGAIIPLSMDLSSAGKIVTGIGGKELIVPVKTQGGYQFMQWNGDAWSSLPNVSKRIGNQIQTAREMEGVDPDKIFGVTKTMSPTAVDFNHMTTEAILNQFDPTTIPKLVAKNFNAAVRNQPVKNQNTGAISYPFKSFVGIEKPEGRAQLLEISNWGGELRKNMINKMGLKEYREAGFPDVAEARAAISAPELLDQPIGMTGHGIARFDPSGELNLDPNDPHFTYTANIKGHPTKGGYAGAFKTPISNEVSFKNYFDTRRALSKPKASDDRAFSMSMPIQKTNQEWLDNVMAEMEAQDRAIKQGLTMDEARFAIMKKEDEPKKLSPKSELGFYSNIEKAALNLKRQSGNGQAYMNDIKKQSGIHNDELEAIGLPEFLKSKKSFTTPEVQEFIANNRLKLIEKKYDGETMPNELMDLPDYFDRLDDALFALGYERDNAPDSILQLAHQNMWGDLAVEVNQDNAPKYGGSEYSKFKTAGGSNYREVILKLPEKEVNYPEIDTTGWKVRTVKDTEIPHTGQRSVQIVDNNDNVRSTRSGFRGTDAEALEQYAAGHNKLNLDDFKARYNFTQGHYSEEPNTMINMRLDDRTDVEGKSGTLLDELQSDWHQKGRKHGYAPEPVEKNAFDNLLQSINEQLHKQIYDELIAKEMAPDDAKKVANTAVGLTPITEKAKQVGREDELNDLIRRMEKTDTGVPDAPYKERWHELGIKKAIIDAVERGDDRLYMPIGKDVANRYDQSKYVSKIVFDDNISGGIGNAEMEDRGSGGMIKAYDHDGNEVINKFVHNPEDITDLIGKEAAKKLFESEAIRTRSGSSGVRRRQLSGVDLEVGGEGMKKYYDEVYPAVLKKFAKQYGGKYGETEIVAGESGMYKIQDVINYFKLDPDEWKNVLSTQERNEFIKKYEQERKFKTRKVYYYEPDEAARVKIKGGVAMKDGGAVHMNEGGDPAAARNALFEANRKAMADKQAVEEATRPRNYAERLTNMYDLGLLKRPNVRPSGGAGIVPSIEPSGNGGPSLINPLNRKDGGDVNLDAMRLALTKGK